MKTNHNPFIMMPLMVIFLAFLTLPAYALPFKIEGAIGVWNHDPNGMINYQGNDVQLNSDLSLKDRNDMNLWVRVEHPIPMLPDIKLQYTPIKVKDDNSPNRPFIFGGTTFDEALHSELEMSIIDVQLYNHLPFLQMASLKGLDVTYGMTFRFLNATAFISEVQSLNEKSRGFSTPMPLLCAGFNFAPLSSFAINGEFQATTYSGNHWYDVTAKLQLAPFSEYIFLGLGYRYQDFKIDNIQDVTTDQTLQGFFAEMGFRFE
ncbi:MAG: TIGR04219 family outer membrane beta-barrel protein [Candidatus Magnetomorum sp.]|nr:TIGR04219 family outer membrane beta-barrel protein [Candidatus Magnetomorum sp.]